MNGEYRSVHLVGRTFGEVVPSGRGGLLNKYTPPTLHPTYMQDSNTVNRCLDSVEWPQQANQPVLAEGTGYSMHAG